MGDKRSRAIGVFDSGLGGLTVVRALRQELPREQILYYGDTARVPYGTKSKEAIIRFSKENARILLRYRVKMIVVACNSCSSYALPVLKQNFPVPVVGVIEPGARKAVEVTRSKRVGVIATAATVKSQAYGKAIKKYSRSMKVFSQACPLFVPLVEEGWAGKPISLMIALDYLTFLKKIKIDTLILGCTHYPLLKNTLQKAVGKRVALIDSGRAVAQEVKEILRKKDLLRASKARPKHRFLISDKPQEFRRIARAFLGENIAVQLLKSKD